MSRSHASVSIVAARYAQAIFELAQRDACEKIIVEQFETLAEALTKSPDVLRMLASPQVRREEKAAALEAAFKGAHALGLQAVRVIAEQGRAAQLCAVANALSELLRAKSGVVQARVTFAASPNAQQQQAVNDIIAKFTGKTPQITTATDADLIGGFTVTVGSTLMDASVRSQLASIRRHLTQAA